MPQARLSFTNDDTVPEASTPSRAVRQLPRKDYAQMHNRRPAVQVPQTRTRGRSASPSPTNRHASARQRSPLSPSSQDTIKPSDSISQISQRVPDIIKKTWKKKPRTGVRSTFSDVYEYFETVSIDSDV